MNTFLPSVAPARSTMSAIAFHRRDDAPSSGTTTALAPWAFHTSRNSGEILSILFSTARIECLGSTASERPCGTSVLKTRMVSKWTTRDIVFLVLRRIFRFMLRVDPARSQPITSRQSEMEAGPRAARGSKPKPGRNRTARDVNPG